MLDILHPDDPEAKRLSSLGPYLALGTSRTEELDRLCRLAARLLRMPMAAMVLAGRHEYWAIGAYNVDDVLLGRMTTLLDHVVSQGGDVSINGLQERFPRDERRKATGSGTDLRSLFASPLLAKDGAVIGVLILFDREPRRLAKEQSKNIREICASAMTHLEARRAERRYQVEAEAWRITETRLSDTNQQLSLAVESSELGIFDWDPRTNEVQYSDRWANMLGLERADLRPDFETWLDLCHPADRRKVEEAAEAYISGREQRFDLEIRMLHTDGDWRWIRSRAKAVAWAASGRAKRLIGSNADITPSKQREATLSEQNKQLSLAEEVAGIGHWRMGLNDDKVYWSPKVFSIHGLVPEDRMVPVDEAVSFYVEEDRPAVEAALARAIAGKKPFQFELRLQRKDGAIRTVLSRGEPQTDANGEVQSLFGIFQDVTEEREMLKMKDDFISTVNHELRTPLTSVFGSLDLLRRATEGDLSPKADRLLDLAHNGCQRLSRLIGDFLDQEKIANGKMEFHPQRVFFDEMVADIVIRHEHLAKAFLVNFDLHLETSETEVSVDPERFNQALTNLLSNAAKYSNEDTTVTIRTSQQGASHVRVSVEDQGSGIPEEFRERIFDRFVRAQQTRTGDIEGSGLGLSIAKHIVEISGGKIHFETEPGVGSIFHIDLPIAEEEDSALCQAS